MHTATRTLPALNLVTLSVTRRRNLTLASQMRTVKTELLMLQNNFHYFFHCLRTKSSKSVPSSLFFRFMSHSNDIINTVDNSLHSTVLILMLTVFQPKLLKLVYIDKFNVHQCQSCPAYYFAVNKKTTLKSLGLCWAAGNFIWAESANRQSSPAQFGQILTKLWPRSKCCFLCTRCRKSRLRECKS